MILDELLKDHTVVPYKGAFPDRMLSWAEALESGKYEQGREQLRKGDNYCCLGVATDLYLKACGLEWDGPGNTSSTYSYDSFTCFPPTSVYAWFGMDEDIHVVLNRKDLTDSLIFVSLNDNPNFRLPFKDIAFLIRESVRLGKES